MFDAFRYYWEEEGLMLRIVETSLVYGYEYFGAYERLVMSELTEKCYKVLTFFIDSYPLKRMIRHFFWNFFI